MISRQALSYEVSRLPALPEAVQRVLAILNSGAADFRELESAILKDQGLAARVLALANSAFFGLTSRVGSVRQACVVLGVHSLHGLALTAGIMSRLAVASVGGFDVRRLWEHATTTAGTALTLARPAGVDRDLAFVASLLHDIGQAVLYTRFPEAGPAVRDFRNAHRCPLHEAEQAVLGVDHAMAGELAAGLWHLPEAVIAAIARHHRPDEPPFSPLIDLVHVANGLAHGLDFCRGDDTGLAEVSEEALTRLHLDWPLLNERLHEARAARTRLSALSPTPA